MKLKWVLIDKSVAAGVTYRLSLPLSENKTIRIQLKDQLGRVVASNYVKGISAVTLNTESVRPGIYFCDIMVDNLQIDQGKLIIVK